MRVYREQDFDKMAERVVDRFMTGEKLADAATQEAMTGELNPDQIARLVHAANTQAFLRLMDQQKAQGDADMTHEFDPIDARQVIQQLVNAAGPLNMTTTVPAAPLGDSDNGPLPDEMSAQRAPAYGDDTQAPPIDDDNNGPFPKGEKQKAQTDKTAEKDPAKSTKGDAQKEAAFCERRLHKFAEILEDQYHQAEWAFEDGMTQLSQHLQVAHNRLSMEDFEKNALAMHSDDFGIAVLNLVRGDQGLPPLEFDTAREKAAALTDHHLVDESAAMSTFSQLVKIATDAMRLQQGAAHVRSMCN